MTKKQSRLHIKIRIVTLRPMSLGEATEKLRRSVRTGIVQEGIRLAWIDWFDPESAGAADSGTYLGDAAQEALGAFYGAIHHEDTATRVEVVHEG